MRLTALHWGVQNDWRRSLRTRDRLAAGAIGKVLILGPTKSWAASRKMRLRAAERILDFELDEVIDNPHAFPLRYEFHDYSHFNPS